MESMTDRTYPGFEPRYRFELRHPKGIEKSEDERSVVLPNTSWIDDVLID